MQKNLLSGRHSVPHIAPDSKKKVCAASVCLDALQTPPFHTYGTSLPPHVTWSGEHCPTEVQLVSNFNLFGSHVKKRSKGISETLISSYLMYLKYGHLSI